MDKEKNEMISGHLSADIKRWMEQRLPEFKNNRNYYINSVVTDYLREKGYSIPDVEASRYRAQGKVSRATSPYYKYYLLPETKAAFDEEAKKQRRNIHSLLSVIIEEDVNQQQTA